MNSFLGSLMRPQIRSQRNRTEQKRPLMRGAKGELMQEDTPEQMRENAAVFAWIVIFIGFMIWLG